MNTIVIASNVTGELCMFQKELLETLTKDGKAIVLCSKTEHFDDLQNLGCEDIETP